jgi:hypothetical protein
MSSSNRETIESNMVGRTGDTPPGSDDPNFLLGKDVHITLRSPNACPLEHENSSRE